MISTLISQIDSAWQLFLKNTDWMAWNLFLALIPLALSIILFILPRFSDFQSNLKSLIWGIGFLVFMAFLPNAPYVLTDLIHLIENIKENDSIWMISLVLIPQYFLFTLIGLLAYVLSVINLAKFLKTQGWPQNQIIIVEFVIHALSAIGVYLGRFLRFNSWHIITELPDLINSVIYDLTAKRSIVIISLMFIVLTILYWAIKQIILGIMLKIPKKKHFFDII
ncbi:hypothetical protein NIES2119_16820 [[Phormidium ambiguum] IAM M-71]|uniref:DUF1361 domain-containing protein n=1 Tax=[Phormidium ambiguum] IAM M-71 TaxID=454136 RepID=A0A1U7IHY1_9CYAN|nr:DUF1361 domain-containing protein [Phormidium ambiguum]OKH36687.1 hypothetical protein NIES2119_16820 [Phormidium ambiguum IAM M-71]